MAVKNHYVLIAGLARVAGVLAMAVDTTLAGLFVAVSIALVLIGSAT